jgi:hypothetical protein
MKSSKRSRKKRSIGESRGADGYSQIPPQHLGAPHSAPRGATGNDLLAPFMLGAAGALIRRISFSFPHCGQEVLSVGVRTSSSTD